jgi:multisubunit Na+/H+ antiporter MnhC subunit
VLLWEGVLAGLLEGTRFLSIRQATLGLAAAWTGQDTGEAALDPIAATLVIGAVIVGSFAITSIALARFQVRSSD